MKKLSLLLLAIVVSLVAVAQLNPYAYGLTSSWNNATKKLTVTYSLNSAAYNDGAGGDPDGVQIHLTDDKNDPKKYYIYGVPAANIGKGKQTFTIDLSSGLDRHGKTIPENKNLYVAITVQGNRKISKPYMYSPGNNANNEFKVYSPHGIAVDKDPNSPNFGNIYVNEGWQETKTGFNTGKAGMYVIDATFDKFNTTCYTGDYNFSQCVIENTYDGLARMGYQPWRVRVSDEGRIFVCSNDMHQRQATNAAGERDGVAVWEVDRNNLHNWTPILHGYRRFVSGQTATNYTFAYKDVNGVEQFIGPICGMDVKGTGDDVTLLLYTVNQAGVWLNMNGFRAYEYNVKAKTLKPISAFNKGTYGYIFEQVTLRYGVDGSYWFGASRADGSDGDKTNGKTKEPNLGHVKLDGATADYTNYNAEFYAGAGLINYKSTYNNETINGANHSWLIAGKDNNGNDNGLFDVFLVTSSADGGASVTRMDGNGGRPNWQGISVKNTGRNLNDFAIDYAENLYVAGNGGNGGRVCAFAMPYGGEKTTIAREQYAFKYQNPVPNILATDLTYAPYGNENKYKFSFNVNTKPEVAQIRFYENEADMLACNNNYAFYYQFPDGDCKQGSMSVIFDAVGGKINGDKTLQDMKLPAGLYYWNVYVKTRESNIFAPIYTQSNTGNDTHYRLHATIDNNPDNDGFGHIYAADYDGTKNRLMVYTIGDGGVEDNKNNINYSERHSLLQCLSLDMVNTRRPAVAPDGTVFLTDHGAGKNVHSSSDGYSAFERGGIYLFDPSNKANAKSTGDATLSRLFPENEVTQGISFYGEGANVKMYKTNTYDEFTNHEASPTYQDAKWRNNGYRIFNIANSDGSIKKSVNVSDGAMTVFTGSYGNKTAGGDAAGNMSVKAVSDGVWFCQHRENKVGDANENPDNFENIALMFYNTSKRRAFASHTATVDGKSLSQETNSIMQSTPGAGMTVSPNGKYLYVVNHDGDILEFQIGGTSDAKTLDHIQTFTTDYVAISTLNFDYAGNLIATAFTDGYPAPYESNIVVYTMPYPNKENARSIPAPKSCRKIPERVAQLGMDNRELGLLIDGHQKKYPGGCAVDIYRPLQGDMFNTICLPFTLNLTSLPEDHPLKGATVREYYGLKLENIGGEDVLELQFKDVNEIVANIPYIIQPRQKEGINHIVRLDGPIQLQDVDEQSVRKTEETTNTYSIIYKGVIPFQYVEPQKDPNTGEILTLMLVADNRLALMTSGGNMLGFRGYFNLNTPLKGIKARITNSKGTTTNTTIVVDGKKVNVEKYLQEGRVYIRMGDSLYTITGEKVE